ncbi:hypothetical protein AB0929_33875 [Streptomyces massasporeus]|uniref:hypothetical protein n=1 Tax=Streptomyces massasporeus TaxID=67324 RepID=UPI003454F92A
MLVDIHYPATPGLAPYSRHSIGGDRTAPVLGDVRVDAPGEGECVLGLAGLEGDAAQQYDPVEGDAVAGEDEDQCDQAGIETGADARVDAIALPAALREGRPAA